MAAAPAAGASCAQRPWPALIDNARRFACRDLVGQSDSQTRASASRSSGTWQHDDFDVVADGAVVGRIFLSNASPVGTPWMWTLAFGHHEDRTLTHGYTKSSEARES
jgi:hypothetical protein